MKSISWLVDLVYTVQRKGEDVVRRMSKGKSIWSAALSLTMLLSPLQGIIPGQAAAADGTATPVSVYMTTWDKTKLLSREADVQFEENAILSPLTVQVDETRAFQTIDGFGAAMTGSSAYVMHHYLDENKRQELLENLFDADKGAGFSYVRLTVGASDFSAESYSYDDMPQGEADPDLTHFSIAKDKEYVIPVMKQALEVNPELKIMATPWSAPGWMKTTGKLEKGKLLPEYYDAYARYFIKFIEAYEDEGIPIHAITVQNEPLYEPSDYPGMRMEAAEQADFIKNHLGPAFKAAGIGAEIIGYDHNWDRPEYPLELLGDPEAGNYLAGTAFHGYAGSVDSQAQVHDRYPDKGIYFTESSGTYAYSVFGDNLNWDLTNLLIGSTRYWAKTVLKWNLALDENHGPKIGGCANCRGVVTVDSEDGGVTYNEEYYAFGQAAKFVRPGAVRIYSSALSEAGIENVAFRNTDGSKALVALNTADKEQTIQVKWGGQSFRYALPAKAAATFVWNGSQTGGVGVNPYGRVEAEDFTAMEDVATGIAEDTAGGQWAGPAGAADTGILAFEGAEFTGGTASVNLRYASDAGAQVELRLNAPDGAVIGAGELAPTGGDQSWKTRSLAVDVPEGTGTLYVVLKGQVKLNWLQFSYSSVKQSLNYMVLSGGMEEGDLSGWTGWSPDGQASAQSVDTDGPHSGAYKLTHWQGQAFQQKTSRMVKVPSGTYSAAVWVKKGDNIRSRLIAEGYGGPALSADAPAKYVGDWTRIEIPQIRVTSGQVEIGVVSESGSGDWAVFDDFELKPVITKAPAVEGAAGAPEAPAGVTAKVYGEGFDIGLNWLPVEGAEGYTVYRSIVSDAASTVTGGVYGDYSGIGMSPADQASYRDSGLRGDTRYYYRVAAFNAAGLSSVTAAVYATTATGSDVTAPAAPEGLTAAAGLERVTLKWEHHLESDFGKYNVYVNGALTASVDPVTESRYTVLGLTAGQSYTFAVSAVDQAGNESLLSGSVTASPEASGTLIPFDNLDFETGTLAGWSEWHPEGQPAANFVDNDSPIGQYKLTHWGGEAYQQSTYRTLTVPDGEYKVQVWVRTGGGQNTFRLEVKNYGGETLHKDLRSASGSAWTPFAIDGIRVTGGKMEISIFSDAKAGNWAAIDNVQVYGYAPAAPAGLKAVGEDGAAALQWSRNTEYDMASYKVYLDGKLNKDGITGNSYTANGLTNGKEYEFRISAVDKSGNESFSSVPVKVTPLVPVAVSNAGFESGDGTGWSGWNPSGNAMFVDNGDPRTGSYKLTHWADKDYMQNTYRTVELPDGTYRASVWVRAGGGQKRLSMEIKKYGGEEFTVDLKPASSSDWTLFVSGPIPVTTGKVEIGLFSEAKAGSWAAFDDVQIAGIASGSGENPGEENPPASTPTPVVTPEPEATASPVPEATVSPAPPAQIFPEATVAPKATPTPTSTPAPAVKRNGDTAVLSGLTLTGRTDEDGRTVTGVKLDPAQLISGAEAGVKELVLALTTASAGQMLEVSLPGSALKEIASSHPDLTLSVTYNGGSYTLPVKALGSILSGADGSAVLKLTVEPLSGEREKAVREAVARGGAQLAAAPVSYELTLEQNGSVKHGSYFGSSYVTRTMTLEGISDPAGLSAVTIGADGAPVFVPARFERSAGGSLSAVLKSNHNSVYAVVKTAAGQAFTDTAGHWAQENINSLASRFVVKGTDGQHYSPDRILTRAEWVTLLVRALGLGGSAADAAGFSDLAAGSWPAGAISAAVQAGLIQGYADGSFRPDAPVTREQMAVTLARALRLAGSPAQSASGPAAGGGFTDAARIAGWATDAVAEAAATGLIAGMPDGSYKPQAQATRAEAAVVISRLIGLAQKHL